MPLVSPVTVVEVAGGLPVTVTGVCAVEPMNGVTVYLVIVLPPLLDGAVQLTVADPLPAVAVTPVGAPGSRDSGSRRWTARRPARCRSRWSPTR